MSLSYQLVNPSEWKISISDHERISLYNINRRIREMVSFELGKEIEKDYFCLVTNVGQRKNSESPGSIPHKDSEFFLYPTLVIR